MANQGCTLCSEAFTKRERGYSRFSLCREIPGTCVTAGQVLEDVAQISFFNSSKLNRNNMKFLCATCWSEVSHLQKYQTVLQSILTKLQTFFSRKRRSSTTSWGETESKIGRVDEELDDDIEIPLPSPQSMAKNLLEKRKSHSLSHTGEDAPERCEINEEEHAPSTRFAEHPYATNSSCNETVIKEVEEASIIEALESPVVPAKFNKWNSICNAVHHRQYSTAIRGLYRATRSTKLHFHKIAAEIVRREIRQLLEKDDPFPLCHRTINASCPKIKDISWEDTVSQMQTKAPLLFSVLRASVANKKNEESLTTGRVDLEPRLGSIIGHILYARAPRIANFLPAAVSVLLWRKGLRKAGLRPMNHLGMCLSFGATSELAKKVLSIGVNSNQQKQTENQTHGNPGQDREGDDDSNMTTANRDVHVPWDELLGGIALEYVAEMPHGMPDEGLLFNNKEMSVGSGMKLQELFGGYMSMCLPEYATDVSDVRQVPDNQEVFVHSATDQSLIVEILEYVSEPDKQALKIHFDDLASSNDAAGANSQVTSVEEAPTDQLAMAECRNAYFLSGQQKVAKFNEAARNTLNVHMGLFRLPDFQSDILLTFNDPVNINPDSSSHGPVPVSSQPWTLESFKTCFTSLKILNSDLFGC